MSAALTIPGTDPAILLTHAFIPESPAENKEIPPAQTKAEVPAPPPAPLKTLAEFDTSYFESPLND